LTGSTGSERRSPFAELALIFAAGMAQMLVVIDYKATAIALPRMAADFQVSADSPPSPVVPPASVADETASPEPVQKNV
jgi:hypothetical protein